MADKTVILRIQVDGFGTANKDLEFLTTETAKLTAEKRKASTESQNAAKVLVAEEGSVAKLRATTALLRQEYNNMALNTEEATKQHENLAKQINANNEKIRDYDRAISGSNTLVGEYSKGIKDSFGDIAKSMVGAGAAVGLVVAAFDKLKEAFFETEKGAQFMKGFDSYIKTYFQSLINGNIQGAETSAELAGMIGIASQKLHEEKRAVDEHISVLGNEIKLLRLKAVTIKDTGEQLKVYQEADAKENEIIKIKTEFMQKELYLMDEMIKLRPTDEKLLDERNQLQIQYNELTGDKNLRIQTKIAADQEKLDKAHEDAIKRWMDEIDETNKKEEKLHEDRLKRAKEEEDLEDKRDLASQKNAIDLQKQQVKDEAAKKKKQKDEENYIGQFALMQKQSMESLKTIEKQDDKDETKRRDIEKQHIEDVKKMKLDALSAVEQAAGMLFQGKKDRLNAEMNAELSQANLTEAQKSAIKRKYALKQQQIDISQAVVNAAISITKTFAEYGFTPAAWVAAAADAATTAVQIGIIKSQKYARGGRISGGARIQPDSNGDDTLIIAKQGEVILNQHQQARLGGARVLKNIGVPGFASGGMVGASNIAQSPGFNFTMDYDRIIGGINEKRVVLSLPDLHKAEKNFNVIVKGNDL